MGGFQDLWIGIRPDQIRIEVLKELFAENLQDAFLVHARWDVQAQHEQSLDAYTDESGQSFRLNPVSSRSEATPLCPQFRVTG